MGTGGTIEIGVGIGVGIGAGLVAPDVTVYSQPLSPTLGVSFADGGDTTLWRAFYFDAQATAEIGWLTIYAYKSSGVASGTIDFELRNSSGGFPLGSVITSTTVNASDFSSDIVTPQPITITFTGGNVTSGTRYWFLFNPTNLTGGAFNLWYRSSAAATIGYSFSNDSGATWTNSNNTDLACEILGY